MTHDDWWDDAATSTRGGGGGGGGSGGGLLTDGDARLVVEDDVTVPGTTDTGSNQLDGFDRVVPPSAPVAGDSFTPALSLYRLEWSMTGTWTGFLDFDGPHEFIPGTPSTPTLSPISAVNAAAWDELAYQHTASFTPCSGLGASTGWHEFEYWVAFVVPAHPVDMAGLYVDVSVDVLTGAGVGAGVLVRALTSAPTGLRGAPVYGSVNPSGTVFLPASVIPDEGETMWIGVTAGWVADHEYGYYCYLEPTPAAATSGRANGITITGFTWATAASGIDLGSATSAGGPSAGSSWEWDVVGVEGSPTFGVDGEALFVTDGGMGISIAGPGEDEDADWGPWDTGGIEIEFSTSDDTAGSIEVTTTGGAAHAVGTILLGGSPSISVAGPISTDSAPFELEVGERYRASFDPRSGELVGKVWKVSDGEPSGIMVLAAIDEAGDVGDRLTVWLRGTGQTVKLHDIKTMAAAESGEQVEYEFLGFASGGTERFRARHRFVQGSLVAHVNGIAAPPIWANGVEFRLDDFPTSMSRMFTTYIVA